MLSSIYNVFNNSLIEKILRYRLSELSNILIHFLKKFLLLFS